LFVGMMPMNVNGTTSPISTAATSHPAAPLITHTTTPHTKLTTASGACIHVARR
jgi:hypothetical protein